MCFNFGLERIAKNACLIEKTAIKFDFAKLFLLWFFCSTLTISLGVVLDFNFDAFMVSVNFFYFFF